MEKSELIQKINKYFRGRPEVAAVYLFGSYAADVQQPESDVDIGILFYHELAEQFSAYIEVYLTELPRAIRKDIHPVIMNGAGELLAKQILGKGKCIHVKDERTLATYKMYMYSMIAEFSYYQKMIKAGFVRSVMG